MEKVTRKGVCLLTLSLCLCLTALAQSTPTKFPTSKNPSLRTWEKTHPTSFQPTVASAREQCNRSADLSATDELTPAMCVKFEEMLSNKTCSVVMVPDGIVFDIMNGLINGRSGMTLNVEKKLGREDRAQLCDLGNNVHAYWYEGDKGKSCNNVGFVFSASPPPPPAVDEIPPPQPTKRLVCVAERFEQHYHGGELHLPGAYIPGCEFNTYVPGLYVPGAIIQSHGSSDTCRLVEE